MKLWNKIRYALRGKMSSLYNPKLLDVPQADLSFLSKPEIPDNSYVPPNYRPEVINCTIQPYESIVQINMNYIPDVKKMIDATSQDPSSDPQ